MNKEAELALKKNRFSKLSGTSKNVKSGGVLRKLTRQIRNAEKEN